jgi:hypothetical protein
MHGRWITAGSLKRALEPESALPYPLGSQQLILVHPTGNGDQ